MTMHVYDTYVGNTEAAEALDEQLANQPTETVTIDDEQRRRSRFRAETAAGTEVGVVLGRILRDGDVLAVDGDADAPCLRVALEPIEAMVVDLSAADDNLTAAVALGHAAGNRHWDMALRGEQALFPATEADERMRATVEPHLPDGATIAWDTVSPALFDDGGPGTGLAGGHGQDHGHSHRHAGDHDHGHDHSHDTDQDHAADHSHDHGHHAHRVASDLFETGGEDP
jgi:urease accessory protein